MTAPPPTRLDPLVSDHDDHIIGEESAAITLVEYGSFSCPYCQAAHEIIGNLRDRFGSRLRYVSRQRPITGNEHALKAAELAEFAAQTGDYWTAHDSLMKRGAALRIDDLPGIAAELGLPPQDPDHSEAVGRAREKVEQQRDSARRSGALVSPTFFINGRRYEGPWDEAALTEAMLRSPGHRLQVAALDFARWAPSTGLLLMLMSVLAVGLANSPAAEAFKRLWQTFFGFFAGGSRSACRCGTGSTTGC